MPPVNEVLNQWLPPEEPDFVRYNADCRNVYHSSRSLVVSMGALLVRNSAGLPIDSEELDFCGQLRIVVDGMKKLNIFKGGTAAIQSHKRNSWRFRLGIERLAISRLLYDIINTFIDTHLIEVTLRLAHIYNDTLTIPGATCNVNVFCNACPMLLYPLRKLNAPRLLLMLAQKRAETASFLLLDSLLVNCLPPDAEQPPQPPPAAFTEPTQPEPPPNPDVTPEQQLEKQDSLTSDTSAEIFRTLTEHLQGQEKKKLTCLQALIKMEEHRVSNFLTTTARVAPQLLAANCVKSTFDSAKVKRPVKKKLVEYYQDVLWGEVGSYLEHGLLWWGSDPLGPLDPIYAHNVTNHLNYLKGIDFIPVSLIAATNSLIDALCCHITLNSWDQLFQKCLVASAQAYSSDKSKFGSEGTSTGILYKNLLLELVTLNNNCENQCLTLEQLPLVEQIPIIHRLDHSVHTTRLWAASRCRQLAASWNVAQFYCIAHTDISNCLQVLNKLEMTNHGVIGRSTTVHVAVCAKMRGKLVSEVRVNVDKLRGTLAECVDVLASNCRTHCLAHLHMTCPPAPYWRQNGPLPDCASDYVENYLDSILKPVLLATDELTETVQVSSAAMILRIVCEAWLEYIYLHRIKFSEWGAVQLLTDFGAVPTWLMERVKLPKHLLNSLLTHEIYTEGGMTQVLRRCEGVGRLLLRRRGESIAMSAPGHRATSHEDKSADNMPAEMYVTNQEQWLQLRAPHSTNVCCRL